MLLSRRISACLVNDMMQTPATYDVLFGRGKPFQKHPGNLRMLTIVQRNRIRYQNATNFNKPMIAREVIEEIRNCYPHVRFLKRKGTNDKNCKDIFAQPYYEATEDEVYKKITHTLRDKTNLCTKQPIKLMNQIKGNEKEEAQLVMPTNQMQGQQTILQNNIFDLDNINPLTNVTTYMRDQFQVPASGQFPHHHMKNFGNESSSSPIIHNNEKVQQASINNFHLSGPPKDLPKMKPNHMVQFLNVDTKYPSCDHNNSTQLVQTSYIKPMYNQKHFDGVSVGDQNDQMPKACLNVGNTQHAAFDIMSQCSRQFSGDSALHSFIVDNPTEHRESEMEINASERVSKLLATNVKYSSNPNEFDPLYESARNQNDNVQKKGPAM